MSEFTQYLLVRASADRVIEQARAHALTAVVLPTSGPWTIVVCPEVDDAALAAFEVCVSYDYAADHGVGFALCAGGRRRGRLSAASEVGHRWKFDADAWAAAGLLSREQTAGFTELLASEEWSHDEIRDRVAKALKIPIKSWVSWRYLTDDWERTLERLPGTVRLERGTLHEARSSSADADAEVSAVRAEPSPSISAEESRALSDSFRHAAALTPSPPRRHAADIDLARCATSREWLDTRKRIDPNTATDAVLDELERTIREGRFEDEGERAIVVREAAAMLLGRCLVSRGIDRKRWLEERRRTAATDEHRAALDIVESVATTHARSC